MYKLIEQGILSVPFRLFVSITFAFTAIFNDKINAYFVYAVTVAFAMYVLLAVFYYSKIALSNRTWASKHKYAILFEHTEHEWRVESNGDCYIRSTFTAKNLGKEKVRKIPFDNIGWLMSPKDIDISCEIIDIGGVNRRIKDAQTSLYEGKLNAVSDKPISFVAWSHVIDPPLSKNQSMKYILKIFTKGTEINAFTEKGTFAGIPINNPTEKAVLKFIAPAGYRFHLIDELIVLDDAGENCTDKYSETKRPTITSSGTLLNWELKRLAPGLRFAFQYRFEKD